MIGVDREIESAFAELMLAPARNVVVLPDDMPEEYGALVEPLPVGYHAAAAAGSRPDDAVLVIGGGPIGQAAALAARRLGARAGGGLRAEHGAARLVEKLGFATIDPMTGDLAEQVQDALGRPATAVLDAVGTSRTLSATVCAPRPLGARIVLVGHGRPRAHASPRSTSARSSAASSAPSPTRRGSSGRPRSGSPPTRGAEHLIDDRVGLDDAPDAFARLASGDLDASKIMVFRTGATRGARPMSVPRIRHVRASVVRGGGADYHDQGAGHWIDDHIATPDGALPRIPAEPPVASASTCSARWSSRSRPTTARSASR